MATGLIHGSDPVITTTNSGLNGTAIYANGLKMAWGQLSASSGATINYGLTFTNTPKIFFTAQGTSTAWSFTIYNNGNPGLSNCKVFIARVSPTTIEEFTSDKGSFILRWFAIGI
jgi:hypothetical protein